MNDKQFIDCVIKSTKPQTTHEVNQYISSLFPGASKLYFDKMPQVQSNQKNEAPPTILNDVSMIKSDFIDVSADLPINYPEDTAFANQGRDLKN
jgi:hypothetical protein